MKLHRPPDHAPLLLLPVLFFAACSTTALRIPRNAPALARAAQDLKFGAKKTRSAEARAASYVDAAALASTYFPDATPAKSAQIIYNTASGKLVDLLRSADDGHLWNRELSLSAYDSTYRLRFHPAERHGGWDPNYFTDFKISQAVKPRLLRRSVTEPGFGGTLVGIRKTPWNPLAPRPQFEPKVGFVAPVTAALDFSGTEATLRLLDPAERKTVRIRGREQPLAADFSAPLGIHKPISEFWQGLMGLMEVEKYLSSSGIYMLHPYDPDRIPVLLVHGLLSTTQMWENVINEVEADPQLRGRFQFWVFGYPTGNPVPYSALRCREDLAKIERLYPMPHGFIIVGHSMGGLIAQMQAIDTGRALWDANLKKRADKLYAKLPPENLVKRALIFDADPHLKRLVFICVPHRGSGLALNSIGAIAIRLITLPTSLTKVITDTMGDALKTVGGKTRLPNSITSLSPRNPTLLAMDKLPIRAPYHSIIGDRGKGDTPNSSDGVVPYWSSHLDGAQSELIVPGPHGSYELPQTIAELVRILHQHLEKKDATPRPQPRTHKK